MQVLSLMCSNFLIFSFVSEYKAHREHVREGETELLEEALALGTDFVRQQGNALEFLLTRKLDGVLQEPRTVALPAMHGVDDDVFHKHHRPTFRRADSEKEVHHGDDGMIIAHHKDAPALRLFQDEFDTALLFGAV